MKNVNRKIRNAAGYFTVGCAVLLTGCSAAKDATESASAKNLNADGYLMMGSIETANAETGTPSGKLIIGRMTYRSRKVGIPADQKVPTTGFFKATKTKNLFGSEEEIIEYDFTAGSDADAEKAEQKLLQMKNAVAEKENDSVQSEKQ